MNYTILDFITLLGSLGLFLYGMKIMSEGLQKVSGEKMRSFLSAMTANRFLGVFTGLLITALVQSSSATTLMTVSFVNAGLLSLGQSISVIMGANIGTTVTAWIISLLGFKVDIATFAIPLIAVTLPLLFSKRPKMNAWGEFIMGFCLLFLGLQFLKSSMPDLQSSPESLAFLQRYTDLGFVSVLIFLLIGTIITMIVQSSSATVALTLIMCSKGWLPFDVTVAMVLGENIGTTITANIGALNANVNAKRAAFSHFLFNVSGVIWVLCLFYPFVEMIKLMTESFSSDPSALYNHLNTLSLQYTPEQMEIITSGAATSDVALQGLQTIIGQQMAAVSIGIALFHTMFNVCNTSIMIWLIPFYEYLCKKVIRAPKKEKQDDTESHLQFISYRMLSMGELSLYQAHNEIAAYAKRVDEMLAMSASMVNAENDKAFQDLFNQAEKNENICDRIEVEIVNFLTRLSDGHLGSETKEEVRVLMRCATEIESLGDTAFNIARTLERARRTNVTLTELQREQIGEIMEIAMKASRRMIEVLDMKSIVASDSHASYDIENMLDNQRDNLQAKNMRDLEEKVYTYSSAVYYLDIVEECEKYGDYALNVVQAVVEKKV